MLDTGQLALSPEALMIFRYGLAAASAGNLERAIAFYDQVLDLQADCFEVWHERGLVLERQGNYADAIASYDRALSLQPPAAACCEVWFERGNALQYGLGDYTQAIACYDRALSFDGRHDTVWQNRGNALLYGLSLPEDALHCYDRAIANNRDNPLAWRNRGNALVELRRYDEAIASYDVALQIQPNDQVSWQARLLAAEKLGDEDHQPTTHPIWSGTGLSHSQTVMEADAQTVGVTNEPGAGAAALTYPLVVIEDDWGRWEIWLERDRYILGRDPKADICLHSQYVSRQHATLLRNDTADGSPGYRIVDGTPDGKLSTNGMMVNGKKVRAADLTHGDVTILGPKVRVTYRLMSSVPG